MFGPSSDNLEMTTTQCQVDSCGRDIKGRRWNATTPNRDDNKTRTERYDKLVNDRYKKKNERRRRDDDNNNADKTDGIAGPSV